METVPLLQEITKVTFFSLRKSITVIQVLHSTFKFTYNLLRELIWFNKFLIRIFDQHLREKQNVVK